MPVALFYFCCIYLPVRENNAYIKPVRGAKKVGDPCSSVHYSLTLRYSHATTQGDMQNNLSLYMTRETKKPAAAK